jgi:hypothetical protein
VEPLAEDGGVVTTPAEEAVSTIERVEPPDERVVTATPSQPANRATSAATRHISRDYSYVRAEVKRIVLVAGFLIVSLIITALLRN